MNHYLINKVSQLTINEFTKSLHPQCKFNLIQFSSIELRLVLTSSHGGQHTSSLFIENKSPLFIVSPTGDKKQTNQISDT